jgi:hypothetical protein
VTHVENDVGIASVELAVVIFWDGNGVEVLLGKEIGMNEMVVVRFLRRLRSDGYELPTDSISNLLQTSSLFSRSNSLQFSRFQFLSRVQRWQKLG